MKAEISCGKILFRKKICIRDTWVAQPVECLILDFSSGHDPRVVGSSPASGPVLSVEPAWDFLSLSSAPLPYSFSLSKIKSIYVLLQNTCLCLCWVLDHQVGRNDLIYCIHQDSGCWSWKFIKPSLKKKEGKKRKEGEREGRVKRNRLP